MHWRLLSQQPASVCAGAAILMLTRQDTTQQSHLPFAHGITFPSVQSAWHQFQIQKLFALLGVFGHGQDIKSRLQKGKSHRLNRISSHSVTFEILLER